MQKKIFRIISYLYEILFFLIFGIANLLKFSFVSSSMLRIGTGISICLVLILTYISFGEKKYAPLITMLLSLNYMISITLCYL